jgi:hypothetical protein
MPQELRKKLQERFNRLKKSLKKALTSKKTKRLSTIGPATLSQQALSK